MDTNLFSNTGAKVEKANLDNYYQEVLEKRIRPESVNNQIEQQAINESKEIGIEEKKFQMDKNPVKYKQDEVLKNAVVYFRGDDMAAKVWMNKYALKDSEGNIYEKSPDEMHWRIACEIARIEQKYKNPMSFEMIYDLIKDFKYIIPQGSPMEIGRAHV